MSYDKPNRIKYAFPYDAGNTSDEVWVITGPKGKAGRIWDYGVEGVTEAFTTGASLAVGKEGDPDANCEELSLAGVAIDSSHHLRGLYDPVADKAAFDALLVEPDVEADVPVYLTLVDDAATGIGVFFVIIDWDD